MVSRKFLSTIILFVFCMVLLASVSLWVGAVPSPSHNVGLTSPGTPYPTGKDVQPYVGWNSCKVLPPEENDPNVGWNSYSLVLPPEKEPVFRPAVGWNS
jgi:hypothetical protein